MADANSAYTLADAAPFEAARRVLPDDDRAAAGARRHHRSRRAASRSWIRPFASTNASAPRTMPSRPSACAPAASSISSSAAWAVSRGEARPRCGAGGGHSGVVRRHAGSGHRPRAQYRALHAAQFRAAGRRVGQQALLDARHYRRRWRPRRTGPSCFATSPASATPSTTITSGRSPSARSPPVERHRRYFTPSSS